MWYEWLIFIVIFILIPVVVVILKKIFNKSLNYGIKGQEKYTNFAMLKLILFYWLCDLFYMCFIIDNLLCKFIFGGLIIAIIFYNFINVFIGEKKNFIGLLTKLGMMQDFVIGVSFTIYLIYIVPNADLQNIIVPIIAGVYGGLLTLVGVACTINYGKEERFSQEQKRDKEKKLEEQKKYKPIFNIYRGKFPDSFIDANFADFSGIYEIGLGYLGDTKQAHKIIIENFVVENSSFVEFYICGIKINDKLYERELNLFVKKEAYIYFNLDRQPLYLPDAFKTISLGVEDLLGNIYYVELGTEIVPANEIKQIEVKGSRRIKIEELSQ